MDIEKVKRLAAELHDKQQAWEMYAVTNAFGKTPEEMQQRRIDYEVAFAELIQARKALDAAQSE